MKKAFALLITIMIFMTACQPTPETEVVVNKADSSIQTTTVEDTDSNVVINESSVEIDEIDIQERWETTLQNGSIIITISADVEIPDVETCPILSIVPIEMDQEWVDKAVEVFLKGATPYEDNGMTKQSIEKKILINKKVMEQIKAGNYTGGFTDKDYDLLEDENSVLLELYESALDNNDLIIADTTYKETYNGQFTLKLMELIGQVNKDCFADLIIMNNPSIKLNYIQFYNYVNNEIVPSVTTSEYYEDKQLNGVTITLTDAKQMADDVISQMGITGVELDEIKTANIYEVNPHFNDEEIESDNQAYEFIYEKTYEGIPVSYFDSRMVVQQDDTDTDPEAYSAVLDPEELVIQVDDSGIIFFNWKNPTYSDGVISENNELLDFETIKEIFMDQVFYHYFYDDPDTTLDIYIDKVILSFYVQPVINSNDEYIAIPVWDFINEGSGEYNSGQASTYLTINAIDGSVINRDLGY